jgi:PAS domain S-box-containing protein
VAVKQDITARKEAEETIRKLSQAVEQSASTIVITNADGDIEYANPAFTRVTGYSLEEALGQNPRILKSGKMSPEFYEAMWKALAAGEVWSGEMINKKKNGELYWEFATIAPVKDENGQITHYIAVKDDITARKEMEEELRIARDRALEASRLKSRILANVSHDMRTPLGSILGYADMLQAEVFGPLNETQQGKIRLIIESSNHLREFVDNLLAQSELEAGKLALQANQISPKKLMQELASGVQVLADQKGLELTSELDPTLPETILGDRYWLRRIIANLLSNAIKFTAQGRIGLAFRRVEESYWAIEVSDTGPGISPDELSKIFEPFQKGGDTRPPVSGAGLGLAIVKDVVEHMGGRITVQSTINQGSTFTVLLSLEMPTEKEA